jgi:hypothetical protein
LVAGILVVAVMVQEQVVPVVDQGRKVNLLLLWKV